MKYHQVLSCFAVISAFLISTAYSVRITASYDIEDSKTVFIVKKVFELKCNVTDNPQKLPLEWKRDGNTITNEFEGRSKTKTKGTVYSLRVTDAGDGDIGNYTCDVGGDRAEFQVVTKILVRVEDNINVVEGRTLKIKCETRGHPPPKLHWTYKNETYNNTYDVDDPSSRVRLYTYKGIENGELQVAVIEKFDRGVYTCIGRPTTAGSIDDDDEITMSPCTVRVKDKYAALWPFLGICAEVFILCLIIFIYEKKRNKTELEESDTDQSPDQKNTPDHGKESNLRHRQ